jgi:cardiolipin synthase
VLAFGLVLSLALPRVIAETAPLSPQALTLGMLTAGGTDSGAASVKIADFADTQTLLQSLGPTADQRDALARHLQVEEAIAGQPLTPGNRVQLLENGPATYQAMFTALRAAKRSIHFESYIFDSDDTGKQFANLLIRKHREGLEVALMVDGVGTVGDSDQMFQQMRDAGVPVVVFHPLNPLKQQGSPSYSPDMRDHRKLLVVDDEVGFTGGVNISAVYSSAPSSRLLRHHRKDESKDEPDHPSWRDTHIEFEGPAVAELERLFQKNWKHSGGPALASASEEPIRPAVMIKRDGNQLPTALRDSTLAVAVRGPAPAGSPEQIDQAVVRIISEDPSRPTGHEIYATYLAQLASAVHTIDITMAYFVPDPRLMGVLEAAARRGVAVRLILPSFTDSWIVLAASRAHYQPLLDAGVQIYEQRGSLLHAKTAVIDGVWSTVGSSNLDWRSFDLNDEVNAVVLGPKFGQEMDVLFQNDLGKAPPIRADQWAQRPLWEKGREHIALLLQRWL